MKRPQHMTMKELAALPVDCDLGPRASAPACAVPADEYGCAFEDDQGHAWGTVLKSGEWVRYPLRRRTPVVGGLTIPAFLSPRRALARLHA